ncbi:MAG: hypothetical protein HC830_10755, partial [Bacteroidetes bacterium]|nr:hypothetical protein [Bacteroidota bacterium]
MEWFPGDEICSRSIYLKDITAGTENYLEFDSILYVNGPVYLGYSVNYSASQDTFAVYQAQDRGVSGFSGMYIFQSGTWHSISGAT